MRCFVRAPPTKPLLSSASARDTECRAAGQIRAPRPAITICQRRPTMLRDPAPVSDREPRIPSALTDDDRSTTGSTATHHVRFRPRSPPDIALPRSLLPDHPLHTTRRRVTAASSMPGTNGLGYVANRCAGIESGSSKNRPPLYERTPLSCRLFTIQSYKKSLFRDLRLANKSFAASFAASFAHFLKSAIWMPVCEISVIQGTISTCASLLRTLRSQRRRSRSAASAGISRAWFVISLISRSSRRSIRLSSSRTWGKRHKPR